MKGFYNSVSNYPLSKKKKNGVSIWTFGLRAQVKAHKIDELKLNGAEVLDKAKGFGSQTAWQTNEISPA